MNANGPCRGRRHTDQHSRASYTPNPIASAQTALQVAILRFGSFLDEARLELSELEYRALIDVLTARAAFENRLRLEQRKKAA